MSWICCDAFPFIAVAVAGSSASVQRWTLPATASTLLDSTSRYGRFINISPCINHFRIIHSCSQTGRWKAKMLFICLPSVPYSALQLPLTCLAVGWSMVCHWAAVSVWSLLLTFSDARYGRGDGTEESTDEQQIKQPNNNSSQGWSYRS